MALGRIFDLIRETRMWVGDRRDLRGEARDSPISYPWINALMVRISREEPRARAGYLWGSLHGAHLAKSIGIPSISLIEFGVAGGNGLLALETIGRAIEQHLGVATAVYGFDTGKGLPPPLDPRDCPNLFQAGGYPMDVDRLRQRLTTANLVLGPIAETIGGFLASRPDPIAFLSFDVDLYSSTRDALAVLEADADRLLPRVHCYFDDITGYTYGDFNGERLAIAEFNQTHESRKISPLYALQYYVPRRHQSALWLHKSYLAHVNDHPLYSAPDGLTRIARRDLS